MKNATSTNATLFLAIRITLAGAAAAITVACGSPDARSEDQGPTVGLDSILNSDIYDNGFLGFSEYDLIFAPAGQVDAKVVVTNKSGEVAQFGFFPDYRYSNGVFGKLRPQNHAETTLPAGDYAMEFYVSGDVATRVPFSVEAGAVSDDPFNPGSKVTFTGPWQDFAYFTFIPNREIETSNLSFWAGASDLPDGETRGAIFVKLTRNGKLVAHSKRNQGTLDHNLLRRHTMMLFQPHERNGEANAIAFSKADMEKNGKYKLTVELTDSGKVIREYEFKSAGGALSPHPRTALGYTPKADYIAPRVLKQGTTSYEFVEAFWIEAP